MPKTTKTKNDYRELLDVGEVIEFPQALSDPKAPAGMRGTFEVLAFRPDGSVQLRNRETGVTAWIRA